MKHQSTHLKDFETVQCPFELCNFQTNIASTWRSHMTRKHNISRDAKFKSCIYVDTQEVIEEHSETQLENCHPPQGIESMTTMEI